MQTLTQIQSLVLPPGRNTVEYKIIFSKADFERARDLCIEYGDPLWSGLSKTTPLADRLQDLQMLMFRLEQADGAKEPEKHFFTDEERKRQL